MEILTSVRRLYISFKSLVNDFVYSFARAALLLLVEVQNHTVPVRERRRIRVNPQVVPSLRRAGFVVCYEWILDYWTRFSLWDRKWTQQIWHCIFNTCPVGKECMPMPFFGNIM